MQACRSLNAESELKMNQKTKERNYQYQLRIDGVVFMHGDPYSIGVLFANFHGRNFGVAAHAAWVASMKAENNCPFEFGSKIELVSPDGKVLHTGAIGEAFNCKETEKA